MRSIVLALVATLLLAGCATPGASIKTSSVDLARVARVVPLEAPTFLASVTLPGVDASTAPIAGEPSIAAAPDGTVYVSAPVIPMVTPGTAQLFLVGSKGHPEQGRVWSSSDAKSFKLLNKDGVLAGNVSGDGDTDIAVDGKGTVYMADLGRGVPLFRSFDKGQSWNATDDITATRNESRDRQWIDARGDGHVALVVAGSERGDPRTVLFVQSHDSGASWSKPRELTNHMIQIGPIVYVNDSTLAMPYVEPENGGFTSQSSNAEGRVRVLVSHDDGASWSDVQVSGTLPRGPGVLFANFAPTVIFPVIAADKAGTLYVAWSQFVDDSAFGAAAGTVIYLAHSSDGGASWSVPRAVTRSENAIFPALAAGEKGRVALAYLSATTPMDPDHSPGPWYLHVMESTTADQDNATWKDALAVPDAIHVGGVCGSGGACFFADGAGDRSLLDFIEIAIVPTTGKVVVSYATDPPTNAKQPEIHVVAQGGGTPLLDLP